MIYAVGDIHGRSDELQRILAVIDTDARAHGLTRPRTVFLGDYVDRGSDSRGVLDALSDPALGARLDPVFLLGNHDAALLDVLRGADPVDWLDFGGDAAVRSYGISEIGPDPRWYRAFLDAVPSAHVRFLEGLRVSHREGGYLFSHAGLDPHRPLDLQGRRGFVHGHHDFRTWPTPFALPVVHGHWVELAVVVAPHRIGVDTGCGFPGGRLSAVALEDGQVRVLG